MRTILRALFDPVEKELAWRRKTTEWKHEQLVPVTLL